MLNKFVLVLSTGGLLFAGYLSSFKFFHHICALNETCPTFLGQPACYFGFVMYLILFLLSIALVLKKLSEKTALSSLLLVSFLGILFAGSFTVQELLLFFERGFRAYVLGLPTCALGLIFYVLIFSLSAFLRFKKDTTS